jgi:hypothetical protein
MDAGQRSVSLKTLGRIAQFLGCQPGDLLDIQTESSPFHSPQLNAQLEARERQLEDGSERGWVHTALLAWQRHYVLGHRRPPRT